MPLYKYTNPDGFRILQNQSFRFSPIIAFNDPFECLADTKLMEHPDWEAAARKTVRLEFERKHPNHVAHLEEAVAEQLLDEHFARELPAYKRLFLEKQRRELKEFRLLCLSRLGPDDPAALLMWAHYGRRLQGHDGMVLEFEENHPWIKWHEFRGGERHNSGEVIYQAKRACYAGMIPTHDILFIKSEHWRYEKEFRLMRMVGDPDFDITNVDALVKFPSEMLTSVTLGVDAPVATEDAVRAALDANPVWKAVPLYRAFLHVDEFRLQLRPIR